MAFANSDLAARVVARRSMRGSTVMEMLAAMLVMAVGIIGVAALYSDTVGSDTDARLQLRAAELAERIADRIAANEAGRIGYVGTVGVVCKPDTERMNAIDAAANEAACWEDTIEAELPSGYGTITRDATRTPATFTVAVSWSAPSKGAASYVIQVSPTNGNR